MKEALKSKILKIEDREMRALVKYEQLIAWQKAGGVKAALQEFRAQIAAAEQAKAVAELRVAQINVISTRVAHFDVKAVRNAQMAAIAAKHRADAAERQAIQEAVAEVLALEELVPTDDIDDILVQVSAGLGIELPTNSDRADICQRGHKSIADLKRELGPPVWAERMVKHENDRFHELRKTDRFAKLIADYSVSVSSFDHIKSNTSDETMWVVFFDDMLAKRDRLFEAITTLRDYATDLVAAKAEPPFPVARLKDRAFARAPWNKALSSIELWALANFDRFDDSVLQWIDRNKNRPEWSDDALDEATLDAAWSVANDQFDAGRTLEQLGWSRPSDEPPDPPQDTRRAAA